MKLLHITIETYHFTEEVNFYKTHAGLNIQQELDLGDKRIAFLSSGESEVSIEIIKNKEAKDAKREHLSIGFKAENLEEKREELLSEGFEVTPILSPIEGVKFFFVTDPAGVSVQFLG